MIALVLATQVALCGLRFNVPRGWTARVERSKEDERQNTKCGIALRPPPYVEELQKSPWDGADPPLSIATFESFGDALKAGYFVRDSGRMVVMGRSEDPASRLHIHHWSGWSGETWYRGFAKSDQIEVPDRVYSGSAIHFALRSGRRNVAVSCWDGRPDGPSFDCRHITDILLRSLR